MFFIEDNGKIYEISSNGERKYIKDIEKSIKISKKRMIING